MQYLVLSRDSRGYWVEIPLAVDLTLVNQKYDLVGQRRDKLQDLRSMLGVEPSKWRIHDDGTALDSQAVQRADGIDEAGARPAI